MIRHIKRWNYWRKRNCNSKMHKLLVLLGFRISPTFEFTLLPDEQFTMDHLFKNKED